MKTETDRTIASRAINANRLDFNVLEAGTGDPLLLLHGFPDHAGTWRALMENLASGYHVIAPDQRGYNLTSRPESVDAYRTDLLVQDMLALLDAMGLQRVAVCGHDWGGIIALHLAMKHPERVSKLIALNSVHPYIFQDRIWDDLEQRAASQYFRQMQNGNPPAVFSEANCGTLLEQWFSTPRAAGLMSADDVEGSRDAWTRPGVWNAMINWYRASGYDIPPPNEAAPQTRWTRDMDYNISQPTMVIWGEDDRVFVRGMTTDLEAHAKNLTILWLKGVGHAPHRHALDKCTKAISTFLAGTA